MNPGHLALQPVLDQQRHPVPPTHHPALPADMETVPAVVSLVPGSTNSPKGLVLLSVNLTWWKKWRILRRSAEKTDFHTVCPNKLVIPIEGFWGGECKPNNEPNEIFGGWIFGINGVQG